MFNLINRVLGRYTIDGHYVGKDTFNLVLNQAQKLDNILERTSLEEIMRDWKTLVDQSNDDFEMERLMELSGMPEHAENFSEDAISKFVLARCYEYVVTKRITRGIK